MSFFGTIPKGATAAQANAARLHAQAHAQAQAAQAAHAAFAGPTLHGYGNHVGISDKRNRNPNWTDQEVERFLELLQEENTLKDLVAQRNKSVFCSVARRLCQEGAPKTWDQCRIKLKNLKSQYRYIKERIPDIDQRDLESDETQRELVQECQAKVISTSNLKHLRFLKRFLSRLHGLRARPEYRLQGQQALSPENSSNGVDTNGGVPVDDKREVQQQLAIGHSGPEMKRRIVERAVSPPTMNGDERIVLTARRRQQQKQQQQPLLPEPSISNHHHQQPQQYQPVFQPDTAQALIEKFNANMMNQFMEHQRHQRASFQQWEMDRVRAHEASLERWRQQSQDHEKEMMKMFSNVLQECNHMMLGMATLGRQQQPPMMEDDEEELMGDDDDDDDDGVYGLEPDVTLNEIVENGNGGISHDDEDLSNGSK